MTCRQFADFIADYQSGELPADVRSEFDRHLQICSNCVKYLTDYTATIVLGKAAFADTNAAVPEDVPDDLVKAILAARR